MSDFKIYYLGINGATDVTSLLTGVPQNLPKDEALEMTDFDKFEAFWNRVAEVPLMSEMKTERN